MSPTDDPHSSGKHWHVISTCVWKREILLTVACWADGRLPSCWYLTLIPSHVSVSSWLSIPPECFSDLSMYVHYVCTVLWMYMCNVSPTCPSVHTHISSDSDVVTETMQACQTSIFGVASSLSPSYTHICLSNLFLLYSAGIIDSHLNSTANNRK